MNRFTSFLINEVIAFIESRMYTDPLLIVKAVYSTFKGQSVYYRMGGGGF